MLAQVLAIIIFLAMFLLIILEIWERQWITLACGLLTLLLVFGLGMHSMGAIMRTLNLQSFFTTGFWYAAGESSEASSGINWQTIIFIAGMMIMVEGMAKVGFFRWLCMEIAKMVKYQVIPIFMTFMLLSFVLAMFIDSITVILFLAAVTIELSQLLEFDPVPMILSEIFCANLGGSATMCGDPPNIIIGTSLGYSFTDFITNTGLMAVVSLVFVVIYFYFAFRKELKKNGANKKDHASYPDPKEAITDCGRKRCTGTSEKSRLQNTAVLCRTVCCRKWSGGNRCSGNSGRLYRICQRWKYCCYDCYYHYRICSGKCLYR